MTVIVLDRQANKILCDELGSNISFDQRSGLVCTTTTARNLPFAKFSSTDSYVAVTAGEKVFCDQFVSHMNDGKYREAMILLTKVQDPQALSTIVVNKKNKRIVPNLTRCSTLNNQMLFSGSGGEFYFHERINGCTPEEAFDKVCNNYYNFCGGTMRFYDFNNGDTNMDETLDILSAQSSSEYENVIFPVGTKPYGAVSIQPESDLDPHQMSIDDILETELEAE
ncbi:hypothetical protein VCR14J2_390319 [Vibrio coralliirubri]|uniref:hypothetical protein n=1 Tax=Vibrio coralliirubri TaxID=1516159 RepID=UPI00063A6E2A|nr:hypothetical protein [Vibrio coralliirubri]CDU05633.1 hypothetical protein VCR14J2_390319 [Vibrio coralliirubri]